MYKKSILVFMAIIFVIHAQEYTPLSRSDRKEFVRASKAIQHAMERGEYESVMRFGGHIVKKYESILLDPGSKNLRNLYLAVERSVNNVALYYASMAKDTTTSKAKLYEAEIEKLVGNSDYYMAVKQYDDFFDYLVERGGADSIMNLHIGTYRKCMQKMYDGTYLSLNNILALRYSRYVDNAFVDSLRNDVEQSHRDVFLMLTSSSDIQDLLDFQGRYPGLYDREILDLIENHRARRRLAIRRKPTIEAIEDYYMIFPAKDRMVDSLYHKLLYDDYRKNRDYHSAMRYLSHFPQGKYAREVRTHVELQNERRTVVQQSQMPGVYWEPEE